ncbi:CopG family ribbon-helix-helix protein [Candidatus Bathyarchaeota archaeon A05DMB-2]|jgi:CopG family nickel-responsive transcriptional regulator|nr:CopG family ribbon-helix-helix protein [Candidatus Bathyarchaeota archaeon A05DMB-2]
MSIISISIQKNLLDQIDQYAKQQGFANRSEIVRQALRSYISESKRLNELQGRITATITLVYQRDGRRGQVMDIQHNYSATILTYLHSHVEAGSCIEVIVTKGEAETIRQLVKALKSSKQISEVKVTIL